MLKFLVRMLLVVGVIWIISNFVDFGQMGMKVLFWATLVIIISVWLRELIFLTREDDDNTNYKVQIDKMVAFFGLFIILSIIFFISGQILLGGLSLITVIASVALASLYILMLNKQKAQGEDNRGIM